MAAATSAASCNKASNTHHQGEALHLLRVQDRVHPRLIRHLLDDEQRVYR